MLSANGRIRPDWAVVNGKEERHLEGSYYLEWREGTKRVRLSIGKDAATATVRRLQKEAELNAKNNGVAVMPENGNNGRTSLPSATKILQCFRSTRRLRLFPLLTSIRLHGKLSGMAWTD
jgi:hypothetical protein